LKRPVKGVCERREKNVCVGTALHLGDFALQIRVGPEVRYRDKVIVPAPQSEPRAKSGATFRDACEVRGYIRTAPARE